MNIMEAVFVLNCIFAALTTVAPAVLLLVHCLEPFVERNKKAVFFF